MKTSPLELYVSCHSAMASSISSSSPDDSCLSRLGCSLGGIWYWEVLDSDTEDGDGDNVPLEGDIAWSWSRLHFVS